MNPRTLMLRVAPAAAACCLGGAAGQARSQVTVTVTGLIDRDLSSQSFLEATGAVGDEWELTVHSSEASFDGFFDGFGFVELEEGILVGTGSEISGHFGGVPIEGVVTVFAPRGLTIQRMGAMAYSSRFDILSAELMAVVDFGLRIAIGDTPGLNWDGLTFLPLGTFDPIATTGRTYIDIDSDSMFSVFQIGAFAVGTLTSVEVVVLGPGVVTIVTAGLVGATARRRAAHR
ncbi:MAG: hypothetical protein AAFR38_12300 [Planctomycetota bacterium]